MEGYGQFCPVAKAAEIFAERWTPLVIRELLAGSHRFNEIRRGVPLMSPSLLSQRLKALERAGIVERREAGRGRTAEYHLTTAGREFQPIVDLLGVWGQRWVTSDLNVDDMDPLLLAWDMRRSVDARELPPGRFVFYVRFTDQPAAKGRCWLVIEDGQVDLCLADPGYDIDVSIESDLRTFTTVWVGHAPMADALRSGAIAVDGPRHLVRLVPKIFVSRYMRSAEDEPASRAAHALVR